MEVNNKTLIIKTNKDKNLRLEIPMIKEILINKQMVIKIIKIQTIQINNWMKMVIKK